MNEAHDPHPSAHSTPTVQARRPRWVTAFIVAAVVIVALVVVAHLTGVMGAGMH